MAHDPKNYRDPKVTDHRQTSGGAMRWIWIGLVVILVLLILSWLFGWTDTDTVATVPDTAPVAEESVVGDDPVVTDPVTDGATTGGDATGTTGDATGGTDTTGDDATTPPAEAAD